MLWVIIDPIADGFPDAVFPTVISEFYSYVPLFLNYVDGRSYATARRFLSPYPSAVPPWPQRLAHYPTQ
jgi:hypothetical protein